MSKAPHHLAIIMDGNRRWARSHGFDVLRGHNKGAVTLREIARNAFAADVSWLTVFAFSSENWSRPSVEVNGLMQLIHRFLSDDVGSLVDENVKFRVIGSRDQFSPEIVKLIEFAEARTSANTGLNLTIALDYGGKQEITKAVQRLVSETASGLIDPAEISADMVKSRMYSAALPQVDMLIRTGGEQRISNFMLWDISYAELFFSDKLWPDFSTADLTEALTEFARRERRFGGNGQVKNSHLKSVPIAGR